MFLSCLPQSHEFFTIGVVQGTVAVTVILLKFALIDLAVIFKEVHSFTRFFSVFELANINPAIIKLVDAMSLHRIVHEHTLVNLASSRNTPAVAICLSVLKTALVDRAISPLFDSIAIWLTLGVHLSLIHSSTWSGFPVECHQSLGVFFIVWLHVFVVVEWSESLVGTLDLGRNIGVTMQFTADFLIIFFCKIMVYCFYQTFDAVFYFNFDFSGCFLHVRGYQSRFREVPLKVLVKSVRHIFHLVVDVFFFVVKLNKTEAFQVAYKFLGCLLKAIHF